MSGHTLSLDSQNQSDKISRDDKDKRLLIFGYTNIRLISTVIHGVTANPSGEQDLFAGFKHRAHWSRSLIGP